MIFQYKENNDKLLSEKIVCLGSKFQEKFIFYCEIIKVRHRQTNHYFLKHGLLTKFLVKMRLKIEKANESTNNFKQNAQENGIRSSQATKAI